MAEIATRALIFAVALASSVSGRDPLSIVKLCKMDEPNINECIKKVANELIPIMVKGMPDYGVPSLDPMITPKMELEQNTEVVQLKLTYTDLVETGLSKMTMTNASVDMDKGIWTLNFFSDMYNIAGKYKAEGSLLMIPMNGEGPFNATYYNVKAETIFHLVKEPRDGKEYFKITQFQLFYTFDTAWMDYENLFYGDKQLEDSTNKFLNDNSHEILNDLKPALEKIYGDMFRKYLQSFFDVEPVSKLFPSE